MHGGTLGHAPDHSPTETRCSLLAGAAALSAASVAALPVTALAATSTAAVNAGAHCTRTGACPCDEPCIWGRQAVDDIGRDGWPNPDVQLLALQRQAAAARQEIKRLDGVNLGLPFNHPLVLQEEAAVARALDAFWGAVRGIIPLPARTEHGVMAKAACLQDVVAQLHGCDLNDDPDLLGLIFSLTADICGEDVRA